MVAITEFAVESWMNRHENDCRFNLAETCVASLSVDELLRLSGKSNTFLGELLPMKLTYGAIEGSLRLREAIAALHTARSAEEVIVTHGAIGANALVYQALIDGGDSVVSFVPTYQQHVSIPESLGAEVRQLRLRADNAFLPDLAELRRLAANAKLIAFSNPNNPTGSLMDRAMLEDIVAIAEANDAWILSDEVYRGLDEGGGTTVSVADLYPKGISVGSMSKAYSLAGLRLGWIVGDPALLRAVTIHRDYSTISVGMIDDLLAAYALESHTAVLGRARGIVARNRTILDEWVGGEPSISWVRPQGGTVALLAYEFDMPSDEFCLRLLEATGVLFTPGSAFAMERTARIGYANETGILQAGLADVSTFLARLRG
jgi:aspartate/methionine/tyrosine aminotransferase